MNLTVSLTHGAASRTPDSGPPISDLTCYVSLPVPVASSLYDIKPAASLVVLSLSRPAAAPSASTDSRPSAIYVGWAGSTLPIPDALGIHPCFAQAIGLRDGDVVQASVCERVHNAPAVTVVSATLRPVSYDAVRASPPEHSAAAQQTVNTAARHYASLTETATILENTILPRIRVIYERMTFPIALPGNDYLNVNVSNLTLSNHKPALRYGIIASGTELSIEPPPYNPDDGTSTRTRLHKRLRVISSSHLDNPPQHHVLFSHALLPLPSQATEHVRFARVSKHHAAEKQYVLPIVFLFDASIPQEHVWLPPFIWHDLNLAPLDLVVIEEVSAFPPITTPLRVSSSHSISSGLPSIRDLCKSRAAIYDGMCVRGGTLKLHPASQSIAFADQRDLQDVPSAAVVSLFEEMKCDSASSQWTQLLGDEARRVLQKPISVKAFHADQNQEIITEDAQMPATPGHAKRDLFSTIPTSHPETDDTLLLALTERMCRSSRTAVHTAMKWVRSTFFSKETSSAMKPSNILLVVGPEGSGKTYFCKTIAAILRRVAMMRTIWIDSTTEKNMSGSFATNIQLAHNAAGDGGRGMVVLDGVNFLKHGKSSDADDNSQESGQVGAHPLEIEIVLRHVQSFSGRIVTIVTCRDSLKLPRRWRGPGVIGCKIFLSSPTVEDRAMLAWSLSQEKHPIEELRSSRDPLDESEDLDIFSPQFDGYSAKDLNLHFAQVMNEHRSSSPNEKGKGRRDAAAAGRKMTKARGKVGRQFDGMMKEGHWSWESVGGCEDAKEVLTDVLLLPSQHSDILENAPISLPRGVLLYGPPGCGKTLLAKAAANESNMRCLVVKGPELMSKYIGESEAEVRRAFTRASAMRPCVLLFDEFDSLAPRRGSGTGVTDRIVNTLLTCMDGAERLSEGVYILATSSRPEMIDPAVLRPGRIDQLVLIDFPSSADDRYDILHRLSKKIFHSSRPIDETLRKISEVTNGYSGADLGAILSDARIKLRKRAGKGKGDNEIVNAATTIEECLKESRPSLSSSERKRYEYMMQTFRTSRKPVRPDATESQRVALQ